MLAALASQAVADQVRALFENQGLNIATALNAAGEYFLPVIILALSERAGPLHNLFNTRCPLGSNAHTPYPQVSHSNGPPGASDPAPPSLQAQAMGFVNRATSTGTMQPGAAGGPPSSAVQSTLSIHPVASSSTGLPSAGWSTVAASSSVMGGSSSGTKRKVRCFGAVMSRMKPVHTEAWSSASSLLTFERERCSAFHLNRS